MVGSAKKRVEELLKLPPDERSQTVEALLASSRRSRSWPLFFRGATPFAARAPRA